MVKNKNKMTISNITQIITNNAVAINKIKATVIVNVQKTTTSNITTNKIFAVKFF